MNSKRKTKNSDRHLVIGAGEVGSAIYKILRFHYDVYIRDRKSGPGGRFEVLHICYPPSRNFVVTTKRYVKTYRPRLVIIHSTVPVGTTRKIGALAVHSPIRGMHTRSHHPGIVRGKPVRKVVGDPKRFARSLKVFVKYFGGGRAHKAAKYFEKLGFKTRIFAKPETTELLKILDTTYYGWNIVFSKEVKRICDKLGLDFEEVYTIPSRDYNEGYTKLGKPHVVRPVLKSMPGKMGGHCIISNCDLLKDWLTETVKKRNKRY